MLLSMSVDWQNQLHRFNIPGSPNTTVHYVRQLLAIVHLTSILESEGDAVNQMLHILVSHCSLKSASSNGGEGDRSTNLDCNHHELRRKARRWDS